MSIEVDCAICDKPLDRPGAQVLSPPDQYGNTKLSYVCVPCWQEGPRLKNIVERIIGKKREWLPFDWSRDVPKPNIQMSTCRHCKLGIELRDEGWRQGSSYYCPEVRGHQHEPVRAPSEVYPHPFPTYCQLVVGSRTPGGTGDEVDIVCGLAMVDGFCPVPAHRSKPIGPVRPTPRYVGSDDYCATCDGPCKDYGP